MDIDIAVTCRGQIIVQAQEHVYWSETASLGDYTSFIML